MLLSISQQKFSAEPTPQQPSKSPRNAVSSRRTLLKDKPDEVSFKRYVAAKNPAIEAMEGIQKGIKVFDGVSLKDIFYLGRNLTSVPLQRGCRNHCSHCFIKAELPQKETADTINSVLWEDFTALTSGLKELKQRVGQDILSHEPNHRHLNLFLDSDMIHAKIPDQKGGTHDVSEATQTAYDALGLPFLTDTAGWHKKDEHAKQAAQKLAKFYKENPLALYAQKVNVSVNPFHSIIEKSVELSKTEPAKAQELRNIYTDRMADALGTFLECGVTPITRVAPYGSHSHKFQKELNDEILEKIEKNFDQSKVSLKTNANFVALKTMLKKPAFQEIIPAGRAESFFEHHEDFQLREHHRDTLDRELKLSKKGHDPFFDKPKIIDINGKVYAGTTLYNKDTGIQLNFINKDKKTAPIYNCLEDASRPNDFEDK